MAIAFYDPVIIVNNVHLHFKPNTVSVVRGTGEAKVEAYSAGGGATETVHTEDLVSRVSVLKGEVSNTLGNYDIVSSFKQFLGLMPITITEGDLAIVIRHCSLVNDPEFNFKSEGSVALEFRGDPAL